MAISYPMAVPSIHDITHLTWTMIDAVGANESPYTFSQEIYEHPGKRWAIDAQLRPMYRETAEGWIAFFAALRGRRGTFLLGDPLGQVARGALGGAPLVKGAGQTGGTLNIDGCTAAVTNWLRKGDWLQEGTGASARLHRSLTDVNTNGSGEATLDLWPGPRTAPADNAALIVANTQGLWRLTSNSRGYGATGGAIYGMSFSAVEAL